MKLNYKKIVDKKFEAVINGYSPTQVDIYLDKICLDYIEYDKKILELEAEIENFKNENIKLKNELATKENELNSKNKNTNLSRTENIDLKINKS